MTDTLVRAPRSYEEALSLISAGIGAIESLKGIGPAQWDRANRQLTRLQLVLSVLDPNR